MSLLVSTSKSSAALRLAGMDKSYRPMRVLDGFDLSVGRGEVVALMGANGAGKSTLAKIASGVVQADKGRIFVAGREVNLGSPRAAREAGIVIVHQSTDELGVPGLSVADNLVLDGLCAGGIGAFVRKRQIQQRARVVAARIGLDVPLDRDFGELGPAHRQLVAIARAVAVDGIVLTKLDGSAKGGVALAIARDVGIRSPGVVVPLGIDADQVFCRFAHSPPQ